MSVWLTPDLAPFLGGTYFPPNDSFGRKSFSSVLTQVAALWRSRRADVQSSADDLLAHLRAETAPSAAPEGELGAADAARLLRASASELLQRFDVTRGGFGGAPKFPRPAELDCLLAASRLPGWPDAARALAAVDASLTAMSRGGLHDALGGGFSRYSVDASWHVPHFEKMTYDNAQLAVSLLDAAVAGGAASHARTARDTLDYLLRDLVRPDGGIFSAEDADSLDPATGELREGFFYAWSAADVEAALPDAAERAAFCRQYDVRPGGNCGDDPRSDPQGEFGGLNVLRTLAAEAEAGGEAAHAALAGAREALARARAAAKPRPRRDEKVVVAWNGMAIRALARASRILPSFPGAGRRCWPSEGRPAAAYLEAAEAAAGFVRKHLYVEESETLLRCFLNTPSAAIHGFADDYAHMALALVELFEASGRVQHLAWAQALLRTLVRAYS